MMSGAKGLIVSNLMGLTNSAIGNRAVEIDDSGEAVKMLGLAVNNEETGVVEIGLKVTVEPADNAGATPTDVTRVFSVGWIDSLGATDVDLNDSVFRRAIIESPRLHLTSLPDP